MPKIPLPNQNAIQHTAAATPLAGSGMTLKYMGDGINAREVGGAISKAGAIMRQYQQLSEETENRLAAAEDRALFNRSFEELRVRLADNPGADDETKNNWIKEFEENYSANRKQYTDRMTQKFRTIHDVDMNSMRAAATNKQLLLLTVSKVQRQRDEAQTLYKEFVRMGDFEGAERIITDNEGGLFSSEEAARLRKKDLPMRKDFYEVSKLVRSNPGLAAAELEEIDSKGQYSRYINLSPDSRRQLLRAAQAADAQRRADENAALVEQLSDGANITVEDIERKFENLNTPADLRQMREQKQIVQKVLHTRAGYKARDTEQRKKNELNALEYEIMAFEFAGNDTERKKQFAEWKNKIFVKYAGDGASVKKLMTQLNETFNAAVKPDSSYKHSYIYVRAKALLAEMKNDFFSRYPGKKGKWYENTYTDEEDIEISNYQMAEIHLDNFIRNNPAATEKDVRTFLDKLKRDVNWAECDKLIQFWGQRSMPNAQNSLTESKNERIGTDKQGRKWVVRDGKVIKPLNDNNGN